MPKPEDLLEAFVFLLDSRGRVRWASRGTPKGGREDSIVGESVAERLPDTERQKFQAALARAVVDGVETTMHIKAPQPTGNREKLVEWDVEMIPVDSQHMHGVACVLLATFTDAPERLTPMDTAVLRMLSKSFSLKDIASSTYRSKSAVDAQIRKLKKRLDCQTIGGLVKAALAKRII